MDRAPKLIKDWKCHMEVSCRVLSLVLSLMGLLLLFLDLPVAITASIIGLLAVGKPEVMLLRGVLHLGKKTAQYYKSKFFVLFKKKPGPHKRVSRGCYYLGLVLLFDNVILLYLAGFFPETMPASKEARYYPLLGADLVFVVSFLFWEVSIGKSSKHSLFENERSRGRSVKTI